MKVDSTLSILLVACIFWIVYLFLNRQSKLHKIVLFYALIGFVGSCIYYFMLSVVKGTITNYDNIEWFSITYLIGTFIIVFLPFRQFDKVQIERLKQDNLLFFYKGLVIALAALSIIPFIQDVISLSTYQVSTFADMYENRTIEKNLVYYISQAKYYFSYWSIPLLFHFLYLGGKYKKYIYFAAFSVFASIISQLSSGARGTLVNYFNYIFFFYLIYKSIMPSYVLVKIKQILLFSAIILTLSLSIITWSRFSTFQTNDSVGVGLTTWVSLYVGEGPLAFAGYMWDTKEYTQGDNSFSLAKTAMGMKTFKDNFERRLYWEDKQNIPNYIFYTVIGDIYSDIGPIFTVTFFLSLSYILVVWIRKRQKYGWRLTDFVILQLYFEFATMGIMTNCYKVYDAQWLNVFTILLCIYLNNFVTKHTK